MDLDVLFKCNWADIAMDKGFKEEEFSLSLVNFSHSVQIGDQFINDLFMLSFQMSRVYYVADEYV